MSLNKLPETLINTLEFLLDQKELRSWSSYEENGQVSLTIKFRDNSCDVGFSTPTYSSFKRRSEKQLQRNSDRRQAWLQNKKREVSDIEHSDSVYDTSKSVKCDDHVEVKSGHFQTCMNDLVPSVRPQPSVDCITPAMHLSSPSEPSSVNNSPNCEDSLESDGDKDCLSNSDKVCQGLARWKYPKYPYGCMPKDLTVSPQEDPYCFYCGTQIKPCEHIEFCASCIENYGNEKHNIACAKCAHQIPEYCTCNPFIVTKGTYPEVDPYDAIIPI